MNNGVENNQIEEPVLIPMETTNVPETTPVSIPVDPTMVPQVQADIPVEPAVITPQPEIVPAEPVVAVPESMPVEPVVTIPDSVPAEPVVAVPETVPAAPVVPADVASSTPETVPTATPVPVQAEVAPQTITFAQTPETTPETSPETTPKTTPPEEEKPAEETQPPKKKKKSSFPTLLFLMLIGLGAYTYFIKTTYEREITEQQYRCSPASETKEEVSLDVNSTIVQELYQKVATSIREDAAQPEWNDTMKIYLAYRQIPEYKKYDSNCNLFSIGRMEPYICEETATFKPKAFKPETLELEWKKLYGETTEMPRINVHLEVGCVGGYEYIEERDEYVQGYCKNAPTTTYKVKKELKEATTSNNMIILKEEVYYYGSDKSKVPSYLINGTYIYTFRLDMNYNYVLINKQYDQKYE